MKRQVLFGVVAMAAGLVLAQVPEMISYQGRLVSGGSLFNGVTNIVTELYDSASGGTRLFAETNRNVVVTDGLYAFKIGDDATGLGMALTNAEVYLQVRIGAQVLSPRERVTSVGYALVARDIEDDAVTTAKILDATIGNADIAPAAGIAASKIQGTALTQGTTFSGDVAGLYNNLQLGADVVGSAEIANNAVGNIEMADNAIGTAEIAADSIQAGDIAADAVGNSELGPNAVTSAEIQDGTVASADILNDTVASIDITDLTIVNADISASAGILGSKIQRADTNNFGAVKFSGGFLPPAVPLAAIADADTRLWSYGRVNTLTASAPVSQLLVLGTNGVTVSATPPNKLVIGATATTLPLLDNVVFVATNGTSAGPGTVEKPFNDPQRGYNAAAALPGVATVVIASGNYKTGITMTAGNVHVQGLSRPVLPLLVVATRPTWQSGGKQRVQDIVVSGMTQIAQGGGAVKFHNCRLEGGTQVTGNDVEFQNCQFAWPTSIPLDIGSSSGEPVRRVGVYQSSVQHGGTSPSVIIRDGALEVEIIGCELVNTNAVGAPAIQVASVGPLSPLHLISHNYIKGHAPDDALQFFQRAVVTFSALPVVAFHQNTVWGDVGAVQCQSYYANNTVYGTIYWQQFNPPGWSKDDYGNVMYPVNPPQLPDPWDD